MEKVLIVDDSKSVTHVLSALVKRSLGLEPVCFANFTDTRECLEKDTDFLAAILDLSLPDAQWGEVVDFVVSKNIPAVVLSGTYDENLRKEILKKGVVDYIIKESKYSYEYALRVIKRLDRNREVKALVVDDSVNYRRLVVDLLKTFNFSVLQVENSPEALTIIEKNPDIKLLVTDYYMPEMDGIELIKAVRRVASPDDLIIIGISGKDADEVSAKFIKYGANDFLRKPFSHEEFHCRVMHNIETKEHLDTIRNFANIDPLTGLFNRRCFEEESGKYIKQAKQDNQSFSFAMLDIDFFKRVNDTYGHDGGDAVLVDLAKLVLDSFKGHISARLGGEEFCILLKGMLLPEAETVLNDLRQKVENMVVYTGGEEIKCTVSIGVSDEGPGDISSIIKAADQNLYKAKEGGRNQVVMP